MIYSFLRGISFVKFYFSLILNLQEIFVRSLVFVKSVFKTCYVQGVITVSSTVCGILQICAFQITF